MKIKFMKQVKEDLSIGADAGDILIVDVDYEFDPDKVEVLAVLKPGTAPSMSQYKEALAKITDDELVTFLHTLPDEDDEVEFEPEEDEDDEEEGDDEPDDEEFDEDGDEGSVV